MHRLVWEPMVRAALVEDLGRAGDLTTDSIVPADVTARFAIVAREAGVCAGLDVASGAFELTDPRTSVTFEVVDGDRLVAGSVLATVEGPARAILTAERTALNFLGHLSGIATTTGSLVDAVAGTGAQVTDTRKTTPASGHSRSTPCAAVAARTTASDSMTRCS